MMHSKTYVAFASTFGALLALAGAVIAQSPQRLTTGSGPGARHPIMALDADTIVYVAMPGQTRELFAVATDGSAPTQLTTAADVHARNGTFDVWAPISVSDDGNVVAYWNAQGVHCLDRVSGTDVVVAITTLLPCPRLDGDGDSLVFQAPVNGDLEVFLVDSAGMNPPQQLTSSSGAGRRMPFIRGDQVLLQKLVGYEMELFVYDLSISTLGPALTSGSGGGNRHGRLTPDGDAVVYEAVVGGVQTAMRLDLTTSNLTVVATGTTGSRLPQADGDDQVLLQSNIVGTEVVYAGPALQTISTTSRRGHRMPSLDRHGQVFVWQQEYQDNLEVFVMRRCWPAAVSNYGSAGTPSVGTLAAFDETWRCEQSVGLRTQLPPSTVGVYAAGFQQQNLPLPQAPGNSLLVDFILTTLVIADTQGDVRAAVPISSNLFGFTFYAQFGLLDPAANALGIVSSEGFAIQIR